MSTVEQRLAEIERLLASSDEAKRAEAKRLYEEFRKTQGGAYVPDISTPDCPVGQHYDPTIQECVPDTPSGCPELPEDGRPQPHKGADKDPNTWKVVPMNDDPSLFKIVDPANINVADQFHAQATADQFIAHHKCTPPPVLCPVGQHPDADGNCVPDDTAPPIPPTDGQVGPYPSTGKQLESTQRGPTTRHYASGKPDDKTIEKNVKNIPYENYQFIVETTIGTIEHDDTISLKFGGTHMGSGWFDTGVSFEAGECCLGVEEDHPSTKLCVIKGPKIGSIVNKRVKIAGVYFKNNNHIELWTDIGTGWKKQVEGDNVNGFNPQSDVDEAQERIDGFDSVPELHLAIVQEIAGSGSTPTPSPQPTPTPEPTPTPGGEIIEDGVKMFHQKIGNPVTFKFSSSNPGRAQYVATLPKCFVNLEQTGYLLIKGVSNEGEEVSLKVRGGPHSGSCPEGGSCYIIGINYDGGVNSQFESPHPKNHSMSSTVVTPKPLGDNIVGKSFGIKAIVYLQGDHDKIECWIDRKGLVNGVPANDWVKFWETTSKEFTGKCNGEAGGCDSERGMFRLDDIKGDPESNVELKFATIREIVTPA